MAKMFDKVSQDFLSAIKGVLEAKKVNKHGHDLPGEEDADIDNDGDTDKSDKYLHNRRKAIGKAMMKKEEAEQIDEISKKLAIKTYAKRNADAFDKDDYEVGSADREYDKRDRTGERIQKKFGKKTLHKAIGAAHKEIFGEEAEQIDELSTGTLQSYRKKARAQGNSIVDKMKMGGGDWSKDQKDTKTLRKRAAGAQASGKQLVKRGESLKTEETELDEAKIWHGDYTATSEKSKFGGHRPKVVHKEKGHTMYLGQHSYKKPETARKHAEAYLTAYSHQGERSADAAVQNFVKAHKNHMHEEVEQVDELSRATVGRYSMKAKSIADNEGGKDRSKGRELAGRKRWGGTMSGVDKAKVPATEEVQIDEISTKLAIDYTGKAADARGHRNLSTPKLDKRYKSMALAHEKIRGRHAKVATTEEVENLDELSKSTLGSYIKKAAPSAIQKGIEHGVKKAERDEMDRNMNRHMSFSDKDKVHDIMKTTHKDVDKPREKALRRNQGIIRATNRLTKEEIEMIEAKLAGVADGSMEGDKHMCATKVFHKEWAEGTPIKTMHADPDADGLIEWYDVMFDHGIERVMTEDMEILQAESHMHSKRKMKEEAEELDEARGRPKKAAAKDFTVHPITKQKLMHNNPEHMKTIEKLEKNKVLEKPKTEAAQHIMNQLQKAKTSMQGGSTIHFTHGESKHVSGSHAAKLITKYQGMKPSEKEDFQKKIGHSHEQLMKHV